MTDTLDQLDELAQRALSIGDIQSAAIFMAAPGSTMLRLVAAAGIQGPPLDALVAAVRNPDHPVARALTDGGPTFDVQPVAPGGPKLRSHLPLVPESDPGHEAVGVLAVAHDAPLDEQERRDLLDLARAAAGAISS